MTKKLTVLISACVAMVLVALAACASSGAPAPRVTPGPAQAAAPESPAKPVAVAGPEEAAWAKVVEAAKKEGKVTVYAYSWTGDAGLAVVKAFRSKYGIDVDLITGRGAEFLERIKTERRMGKVVADFVESSTTHTINMKKDGLTLPATDLPVLRPKDIWILHPLSFDPEAHSVAYLYYLSGVLVNTKLVKPGEEPTSWYDLLHPKWKGKILSNDPSISTGLYTYLMPLLEAGAVSKDYVEKLAEQELRLERSAVQVTEALSRGEYPVAIGSPSSSARFMAEGAPIKMIPLKEGHPATGLVVTLIKDSPHPNSARLLMDWLLSEEGQRITLKPMANSSVRKDVPDYMPEAGQLKNVKIIPENPEVNNKVAEAFRQKLWVDLLKRKN